YFSKNPSVFINKLYQFHLHEKLGVSIPGEGIPRIKKVKDKDWYGTSLPWISIGYETLITPLQTLTFYNAIANNDCMVPPRCVNEIRRDVVDQQRYEPEIIDKKIMKDATLEKAKTLLEGVVNNGSGRGLNITAFKVGGKTGTAQIARNGSYRIGGTTYQGSFVGYFPADNPLYSCIVVINSPANGAYYGGLVAGPVFKEIAEKVYSGGVDFLKPVNQLKDGPVNVPALITTRDEDVRKIARALHLPATVTDRHTYVRTSRKDTTR